MNKNQDKRKKTDKELILKAPYWERQEGETWKAFEAFTVYRDLGRERSLMKVGERLGRLKSMSLINKWSSKYKWVERVEAYEDELDRKTTKNLMKDIAKMRARHVKAALLMQTKSTEYLANANFDPKKGAVTDAKLNEIVAMMKTAVDIERISRGDASEVVETRSAEAMSPVQIYLPSNGRDEDDTN